MERVFVLAAIGVATTCLAAVCAEFVAAPLIRDVVGLPVGFRSDYTSAEAVHQAWAAGACAAALTFLVCGAVVRRLLASRPWIMAFAVCNPPTVFIGFWIYRHVTSGESSEFSGLATWAVWTLVLPVVCTPLLVLGARIATRARGSAAN